MLKLKFLQLNIIKIIPNFIGGKEESKYFVLVNLFLKAIPSRFGFWFFLTYLYTVENLKIMVMENESKVVTLEDLICCNFEYYIGHISPSSNKVWVDQETAELILLEYNAGVRDE
jgi:hypothetical protein